MHFVRSRVGRVCAAACLLATIVACRPAFADKFTFVDREGDTVQVEARLAGSGQDLHALEMANGRLLLVPQQVIKKRATGPDPKPLSTTEMAAHLTDMFGAERIRTHVDKPFVIAYILAKPLADRKDETRVKVFLNKANQFMNSVQSEFLSFMRGVRMKAKPIRFPLVVLIFESERGFDQYAGKVIGRGGLSAGSVAGFYDSISNFLVLRQSECRTFETPLHEAIHQQVHNREILQRLAPIPVWFNEGIATGFEGDGERAQSGPRQVSATYAKLALKARLVDWREIVRNDRAFRGDVFAGEAYGHAWGLHWLLVSKYRTKYVKYIRILAEKQTLAVVQPDERLREFEAAIGKPINELQTEFYRNVAAALKRKRASLQPLTPRPNIAPDWRFASRPLEFKISPAEPLVIAIPCFP